MVKKIFLLLALLLPSTQHSLTITNWNKFYAGSAAFSLSALLIYLNIVEANNNECRKKQKDLEYEEIKKVLSDLNVQFRDYYGYSRSGNYVNTSSIIHETFVEMPASISDEQQFQINLNFKKMSDLKKVEKTSLGTFNTHALQFLLLSMIGAVYFLKNSYE